MPGDAGLTRSAGWQHAATMRRALVVAVAVAVALAGPVVSTGDVAVAKSGDGCPAKLGSLRLSSSSIDEENANKRELKCLYASKDYSKNVVVRVSWLTKAASSSWLSDLEPTYCLRTDEDYVGPGQHGDKTRWGYTFPRGGELYILVGYLATEKGPSAGHIKDLGRKLVARHAELAATCPGAADPDPITDASASSAADPSEADSDPAVSESGAKVTTIVLSGGPDEEIPAVGAAIEVPEDDQHQIVIGGPDGELVREEFIGDQGEIVSYGPIARDADGNWSVLITIDVTTAPEPTSRPSPGSTATPTTTRSPALTPAPTPDSQGTAPTPTPPPPSPRPEPAAVAPSAAPITGAGPAASPAAIPPPELIGVPASVVELVAGLPPEGAGAVRDITDLVAGIGDALDDPKVDEVTETIPPTLIESLRALAPDLVKEVWLTEGSIVVSAKNPNIGSILVTPERGDDGLITVTLDRLRFLESHSIVQVLVAALNGPMAERGRITGISVTPKGITITAERSEQG